MEKLKLTDDSKMPFGMHRDKRLEDVPADYLLFMYEKDRLGPALREYVEENMDVLKKEINEKK